MSAAEQKLLILHVDDDEPNRYAISRMLREAGFEVIEAGTGDESLLKASTDHPDLIILDVRLPDIDGFELCRRFKRAPATSQIPVLHLSAVRTSGAEKAEGLDSGADGYLVRPVDPLELIATVRALLRARQMEHQLREAQLQYKLVIDSIPDYAIFTIDAAGFVTDWAQGAERVKGWKRDEIIGQHVSTFYTPEQIAAGLVDREIEEATVEGRAEREDWRVRKGGERFWGNEIATAMHDPSGALVGFTKISRDLSGRKAMEDALRESEERHRLIVENARDYAIFMISPDARIMTWNSGAERIFGYSEAEIIGQDAAILFTPEDRAAGEHTNELATAAGEGRASDDRWQMRKGGDRFFASGVSNPLRDSAGTLRGFVKVCRDLTENQRIHEQRERLLEQEKVARMEAERATTMKDEFLAVISHELRTPLTSILLWSKMLQGGAVREEDVSDALDAIHQSADAQRQLIEDLLDISRMMSGKMRLNVQDAELVPVIRAAIKTVAPMAEAKGIIVETSLDQSCGRAKIDPDRIQQVIWNLVNNAVKFTDRGGRVSIESRRQEGLVEIRVTDTGRGISAQFLPHVFDRFRQADATSTRMHGGLGLGLSISRQLVELHGGTVRASSEGSGKGATFVIELPVADITTLVRPGAPAAEKASASAPVFEASSQLRGLRVLLVEDEPNSRKAIQRLLEGCQAEVTTVDSAALAIAAFREGLAHRRYHLLVSDVGMPVQNGYELMREVREMERRRGELQPVPAIALTAYARDEDRAKAAAAGFQTHVSKPVDPAELIAVVETLTSDRQAPVDESGARPRP